MVLNHGEGAVDLRKYGPWALIAGGSEGIGAAFAERLAAAGINLILVARRSGPLEELADRLRTQSEVQIRTVVADLSRPEAADIVMRSCAGEEIGLLIYNAGAVPAMVELLDQGEDEALRNTYLNTIGQTAFAARFGKAMRERQRGGIILLGSLAYATGVGRLVTYAASKAYSVILAEGLWYELRPYGVDILCVVATTTRTPAVQRLGMPLDDPAYPSVAPSQVVDEALAALGHGPVWHMDGSEDIVRSLRAMPRTEAVEMVSRSMEHTIPPVQGGRA